MSESSFQPQKGTRKSIGLNAVRIFTVLVTIVIVVVVLLALMGPMVGNIYSGSLIAL